MTFNIPDLGAAKVAHGGRFEELQKEHACAYNELIESVARLTNMLSPFMRDAVPPPTEEKIREAEASKSDIVLHMEGCIRQLRDTSATLESLANRIDL